MKSPNVAASARPVGCICPTDCPVSNHSVVARGRREPRRVSRSSAVVVLLCAKARPEFVGLLGVFARR